MPMPAPVRRPGRLALALLAAVDPAGGQSRARRNAWAGMSEAAARSRARREAEAALDVAAAAAERREHAAR
jgi:hypothetical protein